MSGSGFSFIPDQPVLSPSTPESPSSSFNNKRQFDNAFYPPAPSAFDGPPPPPSSSYQPGWTNNRGGYSNNYQGGGGRYSRFPKRSRPFNYQH